LILGAGEITSWQHPEMSSMQYDGVLAFQRNHAEPGNIQKLRYDA